MLGHSDAELSSLGGYDLVHYDDLAYVASAHQERNENERIRNEREESKFTKFHTQCSRRELQD